MSSITVDPENVPDLSGQLVVDLGTVKELKDQNKENQTQSISNTNNKEKEVDSSYEDEESKEEGSNSSDNEVAESLIETFAPRKQEKIILVFPIDAMRNFGFSNKVIDIISRIISNNWYSVSIKGTRYGFFGSSRGMKQGDPLSPTFFIIASKEPIRETYNHLFTTGEMVKWTWGWISRPLGIDSNSKNIIHIVVKWWKIKSNNVVHGSCNTHWKLIHIIDEIRNKVRNRGIEISHCYKESNTVAAMLAKHAITFSQNTIYLKKTYYLRKQGESWKWTS
ncbi:hypothetical protein FXO38_32887 [Capsicum annuum]|nr:hypothetical protein FXO38_32887 [Capsicum annuum]KAF3658617.1 hypothetical protein FXO37_14341 [Capsicum annuum]